MLRVRLKSGDGPEDVRESEAPDLSIGRAADNDIRIDQPTVSSHHLRILSGLVVADCGSLNGTFVDGERIKGACLVPPGSEISLGGTSTRVVVEACGEVLALDGVRGSDSVATLPASALDELLSATAGTASTSDRSVTDDGDTRAELERLRAEARTARAETESLRAELTRARAELARGERARDVADDQRADGVERPGGALLEHLDEEFARMREQIDRQRSRIAELEAAAAGAPPADGAEVPPLLSRLEKQVEQLESELRAAREAAARGPEDAERRAHENARLHEEVERLREELEGLRDGRDGAAEALWRGLGTEALEGRPPLVDAPALEFLMLEAVRLTGRLERTLRLVCPEEPVVGAADGETVQGPGSLREDVVRVLGDGSDRAARRALAERMQRLGSGFELALEAQRRAAQVVVAELRDALSARALEAREPLAARLRLVGREGELWRRAERVLAGWTDGALGERLRDRTHHEARELRAVSEARREA